MTHAFPIDPLEVLGVSAEATLDEIQTAFRAKSKKLHPDVGGEAWAFRVLVRSHELLSTARVLGRASDEILRTAPQSPDGSVPNPFDVIRPGPVEDGGVRTGARDAHVPPDRVVEVELLLIRFEFDNPISLLVGTNEERNLSCTLQIVFPGPNAASPNLAETEQRLRDLTDAFQRTMRKTRATSSSSRIVDGQFQGWLTYGSAVQADEAFRVLRSHLNGRNLGVRQTIRDMTIPRAWRE